MPDTENIYVSHCNIMFHTVTRSSRPHFSRVKLVTHTGVMKAATKLLVAAYSQYAACRLHLYEAKFS